MIVEMSKEDLELIDKLEKNFSAIFLSKEKIMEEFENNIFTKYFIYIEKSNIIGFVNYYDLYDRFEIANISVVPEFRNKKIGSKLMEHVIELGKRQGIENITLEVREDNEYAIKLYSKYNFKPVAIREKYYEGINGLLMERKMM